MSLTTEDTEMYNPEKPFPRTHLGGTLSPVLLDGYGAAYESFVAAREAFDKIEFNSRDYLPYRDTQGQERVRWPDALAWRESITQNFVDIEEYLLNHIESIHEQNH